MHHGPGENKELTAKYFFHQSEKDILSGLTELRPIL
jgi:hypothetical protein